MKIVICTDDGEVLVELTIADRDNLADRLDLGVALSEARHILETRRDRANP